MKARMQLIMRAIIVSVTLSCVPAIADQKDDEIAKLKAQVEALVKENQQLRQLLAQQSPGQGAAVPTQVKNNETKSAAGVSEEKQSQECWITTSSSKRHNSSCRYYKTSKGSACTKAEGIPCKICGG